MKRVLSVILTVCMMTLVLPMTIFAEEKTLSDSASHGYVLYQKYMPALVDMCEDIDKRIYTEESINALELALTDAKDSMLSEVETTEDFYRCRECYDALYKAFYSELMPKENFEVSFSFSDNYSARKAGNPGSGYAERISCEPGTTLADLFDAYKKESNYIYFGYDFFVILNGVYINFQYLDDETEYFRYHQADKITLHPGDDIVAYNSAPETTLGGALGGSQAYVKQYIDSLRLQKIATDKDEMEAAEYMTVSVSESAPVLGADYSVSTPASGLTVFVSNPQSEKGGYVKTSPLTAGSKPVTTDDNGQASFKLYGEGWVFVQAINLKEDKKGNYTYYADNAPITAGTYYSVESGAGKWIHVTASTRSDAVKAELSEELTAFYEEFDQNLFPSDLLEVFTEAYETGKQAITDSTDLAVGRKAEQTAFLAMQQAYDNAVSENANRLKNFRSALAKLPEDVSLITQGEQSKVDAVKTAYGRLTPYLVSQLSGQETDKYQKIASLTDLPEAKEYAVTVKVVADSEEATETLNRMIDWLNSDEGRYYDANNQGKYGEGEPVSKIYVPNTYKSFNDKDYLTSGKRAPAEPVCIVTDFNTAAWIPVLYRDQGKTYVGDQGDEYTRVEGDGWTIYDTKEGGVSLVKVGGYRTATPIGNLRVLLNGVAYEPKNITFEGVDDVTFPDYFAIREPSDYKGIDKFNLKFQEAYATFEMPYNDVTITITWGKVKISTAVSEAADELTKVYNSCVKANYSDEAWTELSAIYENGIKAIRKSSEPDAARSEYAEKMMAVPTKKKQSELGSVQVTISNHTYAENVWYDEEEPFVSETVELEADDSMMTAILKALEVNGFSWKGTGGQSLEDSYDITYLSSIFRGDEELAEFSGGSGSGWMGTLNDWFTNQGFAAFTVENGMLKDGDCIDVVYTCDLGNDVGCGMEGTSDTSMQELKLSNGTLKSDFSGDKKAYTFVLNAGKHSCELKFEAKWKVFMCKAYKGSYQPDSSEYYRSGDSIYLEDGDTIYIGCGDPAWPSMSGNSGVSFVASVYKITVISSEQLDMVADAINDIGTVTLDSKAAIEAARAAYETLTEEEKTYVDTYVYDTLLQAEKQYAELKAAYEKEQAYAKRPLNKITASSLVKEYSSYKKTYSINAKVLGGAKLSYSSSSSKVKVSSKGVITVPAKYVGKVTITIKAADTDQYKAVSKKITITVNPKTTSIVSVKNTAAGKMTVKWKRNSAVTGYQLQYSTSSSFKSGNKTLSITSNKTLRKTVKSLKKKKTYYVRIRTYKKVGSVKYYSKWSTKKSVKISR